MPEVLTRKHPKNAEFRYDLSEKGQKELITYTDKLIAQGSGDFVKRSEVEEALERMDPKQLLKDRPEGMSEEEFVGAYKLAALTETATDLYARAFTDAGTKYGQEAWLNRFTEEVWVPDEKTHDIPFEGVLLRLDAVSEEGFRAEMKQAQEAQFDYGRNFTPVGVVTFGGIQEVLTDHYHGLLGDAAKKSPVNVPLAREIIHVKKRESAHIGYYGKFGIIQIRDMLERGNRDIPQQIAQAGAEFTLPGNVIEVIRQYQEQAPGYLEKFGADVPDLVSRILRTTANMVNRDPVLAGQTMLDVAARREMEILPFLPAAWLNAALDYETKSGRINAGLEWASSRIYGLIGRGMVESTRKRPEGEQPDPKGFGEWMEQKIAYKIRHSDIFGGKAA